MKTFKTLLFASSIAFTMIFTSCKKEEIKPNTPVQPVEECNCGIITDSEIEWYDNEIYYSLTIENECSGNLGKYYFNQEDWFYANVGGRFCITNVTSWSPTKEGFDKLSTNVTKQFGILAENP